MTAQYRLDKTNAKLMGVCAGFARMTDTDVTLIRIALVLLTLFALGPIALLAYFLVGVIANAG